MWDNDEDHSLQNPINAGFLTVLLAEYERAAASRTRGDGFLSTCGTSAAVAQATFEQQVWTGTVRPSPLSRGAQSKYCSPLGQWGTFQLLLTPHPSAEGHSPGAALSCSPLNQLAHAWRHEGAQSLGSPLKCVWCSSPCSILPLCCREQRDYILGGNPLGMSYMVGYLGADMNRKTPGYVHHRAASIPPKQSEDDVLDCSSGLRFLRSAVTSVHASLTARSAQQSLMFRCVPSLLAPCANGD